MAGELGFNTVLSCTSRSKIWEPAGDDSRVELERARVGDDGCTNTACSLVSARVGDLVVLEAVVDALNVLDALDAWGAKGGVLFLLLLASGGDLNLLSSFFLTNPNRDRLLVLMFLSLFSMAEPSTGFSTVLGVESSMLVPSATSTPLLGARSPFPGLGDVTKLMIDLPDETVNKGAIRIDLYLVQG